MKNIDKLKNEDFYSILLFLLYKLCDNEEYSTLSRLAYILDKNNLLKICKFFGGHTIKIPKIEELEIICTALLIYQKVDIEKNDVNEVYNSINTELNTKKRVFGLYKSIREVIKDYEFAI